MFGWRGDSVKSASMCCELTCDSQDMRKGGGKGGNGGECGGSVCEGRGCKMKTNRSCAVVGGDKGRDKWTKSRYR